MFKLILLRFLECELKGLWILAMFRLKRQSKSKYAYRCQTFSLVNAHVHVEVWHTILFCAIIDAVLIVFIPKLVEIAGHLICRLLRIGRKTVSFKDLLPNNVQNMVGVAEHTNVLHGVDSREGSVELAVGEDFVVIEGYAHPVQSLA